MAGSRIVRASEWRNKSARDVDAQLFDEPAREFDGQVELLCARCVEPEVS